MDKMQLIKDYFEQDEECKDKVLNIKCLDEDREIYEVEYLSGYDHKKHTTEVGFIDDIHVLPLPK